ncbi:MAG: hypothetical protein WDW36_009649 [Sanguina aurantia]
MIRLAGREEFVSINTDYTVDDDAVDAEERLYYGPEQDDDGEAAEDGEPEAGQSRAEPTQQPGSHDISTSDSDEQGLAGDGGQQSSEAAAAGLEVQQQQPEQEEEEEEIPYGPMRVWVLMGGDGAERHASLAAGRAVMSGMSKFRDAMVGLAGFRSRAPSGSLGTLLRLLGAGRSVPHKTRASRSCTLPACPHSTANFVSPHRKGRHIIEFEGAYPGRRKAPLSRDQVEPFVLAPSGRGADEQRRRASLLARRNTWLELGFDEAGLPDLLQLDEIRTMTPLQTTLENEPVWAVPMAAVMRGTVEEAVEACERVLARTNVASHALPPLAAQVEGLQEEVQAELMAAGLVTPSIVTPFTPCPLPGTSPTLTQHHRNVGRPGYRCGYVCMQRWVSTLARPHTMLPVVVVAPESGEEADAACRHRSEPEPAVVTDAGAPVMLPLQRGVCGLWDSDHTMQPLNPRALSLGDFAAEAAKHNAVVYLGALPGRLGQDGTVVQMLESEGVVTTALRLSVPREGPCHRRAPAAAAYQPLSLRADAACQQTRAASGLSSTACMATYDRAVLSEILSQLPANLGVQCLPSVDVPVQHLMKAAAHEDVALDLMETMREMLQSGQLAIRPLCGSSSAAVARLSLYSDMHQYCVALAQRLPEIPANSLSRPHAPIPLHTFLPSTFIIEPFIGTDPVILTRQHSGSHHASSSSSAGAGSSSAAVDESHSSSSSSSSSAASPTSDEEVTLRVDWAGEKPWVRVCMGLMGNVARLSTRTSPSSSRRRHRPPAWSVIPHEARTLPSNSRAPRGAPCLAVTTPAPWGGPTGPNTFLSHRPPFPDPQPPSAPRVFRTGRHGALRPLHPSLHPTSRGRRLTGHLLTLHTHRRLPRFTSLITPIPRTHTSSGGSSGSGSGGCSKRARHASGGGARGGGQEVVPYTSAEVECWPVTWVTPAPPSILPHDVVRSAQMRARVVADRLGLAGLCQLDCLVHAGSGEMLVLNINACPLLTADSPLLRQALLLPVPMLPSDLVRATILLAVQHADEEEEAVRGSEAEGGMSASSTMDAYDNEDERASMLEDLERLRDQEEGYGGPGGQEDDAEESSDIL